jgi:hypothetical protein
VESKPSLVKKPLDGFIDCFQHPLPFPQPVPAKPNLEVPLFRNATIAVRSAINPRHPGRCIRSRWRLARAG